MNRMKSSRFLTVRRVGSAVTRRFTSRTCVGRDGVTCPRLVDAGLGCSWACGRFSGLLMSADGGRSQAVCARWRGGFASEADVAVVLVAEHQPEVPDVVPDHIDVAVCLVPRELEEG